MERWAAVAGHPGYEVSDHGNVRSLDRTVVQQSPYGVPMERRLQGKSLNCMRMSNGYQGAILGRGSKVHMVHRLVATAFVEGHADGLVVNHKNGDRQDNRAENLEWVTHGENHRHSYQTLGRKQHAASRALIVQGIGEFVSVKAAARHIGAHPSTVAFAAKNNRKVKGYEVAYV